MSSLMRAVAATMAFFASAGSASAATIGFDELRTRLAAGSVVLVDVREPEEFVAGHVPGAINMPLSRFNPIALPLVADRTTIVMCRSGNRSGQAQRLAHRAGRTDVLNYHGSIMEWTAKGGPIEKGN